MVIMRIKKRVIIVYPIVVKNRLSLIRLYSSHPSAIYVKTSLLSLWCFIRCMASCFFVQSFCVSQKRHDGIFLSWLAITMREKSVLNSSMRVSETKFTGHFLQLWLHSSDSVIREQRFSRIEAV